MHWNAASYLCTRAYNFHSILQSVLRVLPRQRNSCFGKLHMLNTWIFSISNIHSGYVLKENVIIMFKPPSFVLSSTVLPSDSTCEAAELVSLHGKKEPLKIRQGMDHVTWKPDPDVARGNNDTLFQTPHQSMPRLWKRMLWSLSTRIDFLSLSCLPCHQTPVRCERWIWDETGRSLRTINDQKMETIAPSPLPLPL